METNNLFGGFSVAMNKFVSINYFTIGEYTKMVRDMFSQLLVTLYMYTIYLSLYTQTAETTSPEPFFVNYPVYKKKIKFISPFLHNIRITIRCNPTKNVHDVTCAPQTNSFPCAILLLWIYTQCRTAFHG